MISHISVSDFAIIDRLSLSLQEGLNIITGETGAGKSIIIEAISLGLGSRADSSFVRSGREKASVEILFEDLDPSFFEFFREVCSGSPDPEETGQILITRELTAGGKSLCRVNGQVVSVSQLNRLCKRLADIHGQYDHQALLNPENHIRFVDLYGAAEILPEKEAAAGAFTRCQKLEQALRQLKKGQEEVLRQKDFMEFELSEIRQVRPVPQEDRQLSERISLLENSENIYLRLSEAYALLYEEAPSVQSALKQAEQSLGQASSFSEEIARQQEVLTDCYYRISDAAEEIRRFRDSVTFSPEELDQAIRRLDQLEALKRKHGGSLESVLAHGETLERKLDELALSDSSQADLEEQLRRERKTLELRCRRLSALRERTSEDLSRLINRQLDQLNFKDSRLEIRRTEKAADETGSDHLEFFISTNKGEIPKPLSKIASGGEISRIMLAFKEILGDLDSVPTMIFDEIDSGISGVTASVVGRKLQEISRNRQIVCITHLPQIAACGDHNYKIQKVSDEISTHTTVLPLSREETVLELARLTGGMTLTEAAMENARQLLESSRRPAE